MSRKVKCFATGEQGTNDTFYKSPDGKYFKSFEIYTAWCAGREYQKKQNKRKKSPAKERTDEYMATLAILCEYLGYSTDQIIPPILIKKIKELDAYSDEVILETAKRCQKDILYAFDSKTFASDNGKICYMMAIIRNKLPEVDKNMKQLAEAKANATIEKKDSLDFIVQDFESKSTEVTDFSSLLGDDDLWT